MTTLSKEEFVRWADLLRDDPEQRVADLQHKCDAKDQQISSLVAENERLTSELSKHEAIPQYKEARKAEVAVLREQLAVTKAENERLLVISAENYDKLTGWQAACLEAESQLTATRTALAAAEAENKRLRNALNEILTTDWVSDRVRRTVKTALAQPRDDSALREMIDGVYEECAAKLKSKHDYECSAAAHHAKSFHAAYEHHMTRQAVLSECLDIIRALAEKKLASLTS